MSMSLQQLQQMMTAFPETIVLFGVPHNGELAAAGLCLRLGRGILYVFYWGDKPGYDTYSPVVQIASAAYRYCQQQGLDLLDVGTSTVDSEANHGLVRFKRSLGFAESLKVCMTKIV
jgi:hypothetical protein